MAGAADPATAPSKLDVPASAQCRAAAGQIDELRQRNPLEYGPTRLLELARETSSSAAMRYSAAYRAMEISAKTGRVPVALAALDYLERTFATSGIELRKELLTHLAGSPARASAAILAMRWSEELYREAKVSEAAFYAAIVEQCRGELGSDLQRAAADYLADHEYAKGCTPAVRACLYRGLWDQELRNIPETAGEVANAAREDLAAADDAARLRAADTWWSLGEKQGGMTGTRIAARAIGIYGRLTQVGGVERELIASRKAEHERRSLKALGYMPGLTREIWRGDSGHRRRDVVTELEVDRDNPKLDLPREDGRVRLQGHLLISSGGLHELIFTAGSAIKVTVDGEMKLEDPAVYRKRSGARVLLDLTPGLHALEIEVSANSSKPRLHVEWITPTNPEKRSIPHTSFFYDPLQQ